MTDCKICVHNDVCERWCYQEGQDASCYSTDESGCSYFREANKWIPVTERLPDLIPCNAGTAYSEAVIVWTDGRKAMVAVWDGIDFLCASEYWEAEWEEVTHWMPLPTPPKEETTDA